MRGFGNGIRGEKSKRSGVWTIRQSGDLIGLVVPLSTKEYLAVPALYVPYDRKRTFPTLIDAALWLSSVYPKEKQGA